MESDKRVEIIEKAIRKLMEEEEEEIYAKTSSSPLSFSASRQHHDNEKPAGRRRQFLSNLLSELKSMEEVKNFNEEANGEDDTPQLSSEMDEKKMSTKKEVGNEEIIKELKNVKRQNSITQSLVTAMIVLTLAWQLSEVSLILKIKDGFTNPLKSVGGLIGGFFRNRRGVNNVQDVIKHASEMQKQVMEPTSLPGLKIPGFDTSDNEDED